MQQDNWDIIGTHISIQIDTDSDCSILFGSIRDRLRDFELRYSRFIEWNWLDTLNQTRYAILDDDGSAMLSFALETARETDGYFDPTIAGRLSSLGYGRAEHSGRHTWWQYIEKNEKEVILHSDVILEFGGVGKWYLLDIIRVMIHTSQIEVDIPRYMVDFGGDIYAIGGWEVWLENPHNLEEVIGIITLDDGFFACSSWAKRKWGTHHHLIDPKTWESANEVIATYIEARSGMVADSYATALAVMPFLQAAEFLYRSDILEGVILASDGRCFQSEWSRVRLFQE
jgi:FAD:protein FMN transferase